MTDAHPAGEPARPDHLLRRDDELGRLAAALGRPLRGEGALVLLSGPAGIGKTALLGEARTRAERAGLRVLSGAASELDRDFPFGLVHQLLEQVLAGADPQRRERLLAGAAARAETILVPPDDAELPQDPGYAVLHGLFWLVANLADEAPLALLVDDLHWADRASLRMLEYLARRLEALPVLVVATARPDEPGADTDLLLALEAAAAAEVVRPRVLDAPAVTALLTGALGTPPDEAFAAACAQATGGNPLLLRTVAVQAAEAGLTGRAEEAAGVADLAATGLGVVVRRRLTGLGPDAVAIARAAAVLGPPARLGDLAAVAEVDLDRTRAAADRLDAAALLEAPTWRFVHPVVRAAVVATLSHADRARLHGRAAERLRATHAPVGRLAVHLMATGPAGDPRVVADLRAAAHAAAAEGAPDAGALHLRRALDEPPAPAERPVVLLELGELEVRAGSPAAAEHLTAALDAGLHGDLAARARAARGDLRLLVDPAPALDEFAAALADATDPELRTRLEALLLEATMFHVGFAERRAALLAAGRARPEPSPVVFAHLALDGGYGAMPADEVVALATRAVADDALVRVGGPVSATVQLVVNALRAAERPEPALALLEHGEAVARREGLRFAEFLLEHGAALWHVDFGSLAAALAHATTGLDKVRASGFDVALPAYASIVGTLLAEADRADEARALLEGLGTGPVELVGGPYALAARGALRLGTARAADGAADLRAAAEQFDRRGWAHSAAVHARLPLAEHLGAHGAREEAVAIAREAHALLTAAGRAGAAAGALRVEGRVLGGDEGLALLEQAADRLAGTPLVRERCRALLDLGGALRRAGRRTEARESLRVALDLARRVEGARLARLARDELVAAGGRATREALSGPAALTPSERRAAELAASGMTNREIAETLWVTRKTVELHLGSAYGKLGIRSRSQLADVLGAPAEAAAA